MLTVYKASAGSGKTFRLAIEYIKRLIKKTTNYESTLAVTFTNKATEEMKMRILSQLYGIANGLKDSNGYLNVLLEELPKENEVNRFTNKKIDKDFIRKCAAEALQQLLHHYNFFKIETIDSFFQTVLRNLARELDLSPNLRVEIADDEVVNRAVDRWIDSLSEKDNELNWILDYVNSSMDDEKSWNIISNIKKFAKNLLEDDYKEVSEVIENTMNNADSNFFKAYTESLKKTAANAAKEVQEAGEELWQIITANGMDETSFSYGKGGVGGFMKKLSIVDLCDIEIGTRTIAATNPDDNEAKAWMKKTASKADKEFCINTLRPLLIKIVEKLPELQIQAKSARVTLSNLSSLRMLHAIQKEIDKYNQEQDSFLLSDTQELLNRMIGDSDTPFIFEKLGTQLETIMIDEFQDTSRIQWENFKVLLKDSMSNGHDDLIVGDVKQSIYRWRSGDWRLLNNIEGEFPDKTNIETLQINRRSSTRVIDFNNALFKHAIENIYEEVSNNCKKEDAEMLKSAYADVKQEYPENKDASGFVNVRFIDKDSHEDETLKYVADTIIALCEKGAEPKGIAILVRNNKYIPMITNYCIEEFRKSENPAIQKLSIISDEAYLLEASPAVNIIIDALKVLANPDDLIARAQLSVRYQRYVLKSKEPQSALLFNPILPEKFTEQERHLANMPLYQICEELYSIFSVADIDQQSAFICRFFDGLMAYMQSGIIDIPSFLTYWDDSMHKDKVESDKNNGISIMSIHKSKGLEFQTVIVPFCDWIHDPFGSLLWCKPDIAPYNELPVIPVNSKKINNTIYNDEYWEERLQIEVDNINLLYVALTRAVDNLYISVLTGQSAINRGKVIEDIMPKVSKELGYDEVKAKDYCFGEVVIGRNDNDKNDKDEDDEKEENVFLITPEPVNVIPQNNSKQPEFRESNKSKEFTLTDEQEDEQLRSQYIQLGNVLHSILSKIRTADDIDAAILQMEMEGLLSGQDITSEAIRERIMLSMQHPEVSRWFEPGWQLYNECTIIARDENGDMKEHRPDRVMTNGEETIVVDFKLYSYNSDYEYQVKRYIENLKKMGHKNIRGFIWMVMSGKVKDVK